MTPYPLPSNFDEQALKAVLTEHLDLTDPKEIERAFTKIKIALKLGESQFLVAPNDEADRLDELRSHLQGALSAYNALSLPSILALSKRLRDKKGDNDLHRDGLFTTITKLVDAAESPIKFAKNRSGRLGQIKGESGPTPNWQSIALAHACSQLWLEYKGELKTSISMATHLEDPDNPDDDSVKIPIAPFGRFVEAVWHASAIGTDYYSTFKNQYKGKSSYLKPITQF